MRSAIKVILAAAFLWAIVCTIWPFWNKYWLEQNLRTIALYGTKKSIKSTRDKLSKDLKVRGSDFVERDFDIEKDGNNKVTISIEYVDEIRMFGVTLKELEFIIEITVRETESSF